MINKKELGFWGEKQAKEFLADRGWKFIDKNIEIGKGELDLLYQSGDHLIVVEVKTKQSNEFGEPAELVGQQKISQIEYLMGELLHRRNYMKKYSLYDIYSWQLDVVAVYGDGEEMYKILHFENVTMWG